ncbi:hypothetical protein GXM_05443 [Nostoc sphaeroides CCNUC1]|uniref:Uncharacterized protein n=1 Tax=Nostoc sphaeroides CCNUC1 TaxID=2653204 RepID=A0A5P8W615_9NOSO|nr:hypothetical protein GXM_05443 [Nostoc sphaeroides CCNUC1]
MVFTLILPTRLKGLGWNSRLLKSFAAVCHSFKIQAIALNSRTSI